MLLLSGALATGLGLGGCSDSNPPPAPGQAWNGMALADDNNQDQQNNAYVPGLGYYHTPFHSWYPFPFNFHRPDRGYYYGGVWHPNSYVGPVPASSRPSAAGWMRARSLLGYHGGSGGAGSGGGFAGFSAFGGHASGSVTRGGFGSSAASHGFGGGA